MMNEYSELSHYHTFMEYFGDKITFQTFDDKVKNKKLIKQLHGSLKQHFKTLTRLNKQGAGIFFCVNETDLEGRSTKNITKVRAVFIDLDGTPLPQKFELQPHLIVNSSPNKYHCYWLVSDMLLESFPLFQEALANRFKSDPKVKDLPRVMRVAGFYHNKTKSPYPVKVINRIDREPYTQKEIKEGLMLKRPEKKKITDYKPSFYQGKYTGTLRYGSKEGDRHGQLIKMLIAIRLRGEDYDYLKNEALTFAKLCDPPEDETEVLFQVNDIWNRYQPREAK